MNLSRSVSLALGAAALPALIAGCGGSNSVPSGGQPLASQQSTFRTPSQAFGLTDADLAGTTALTRGLPVLSPSWIDPDVAAGAVTKKLLYASSFAGSYVNIYDLQKQKLVGQITGLTSPNGLNVDAKGNLYVCNEGANDVLVFARGKTSPFKTLTDAGEYPVDVTFDTDGTIYVANLISTINGPGSVSVYKKGATSPTYMIKDVNNIQRANSVALDATHNLYLSNNKSVPPKGPGDVLIFKPNSHGPGKLTPIKLKIAGGIKLDASGNVVVNDQTRPSTDVYSPGGKKLVKRIPQTGEPYRLAFTVGKKSFFVANVTNAEVDEFTYPGGKLINRITNGFTSTNQPIGVAVDPSAPN